MSAWSDYLSALSGTSAVTLVGPLYNQPHAPTMPTIYVDGGSRFRPAGEMRDGARLISVGDGDSNSAALDEALPAEKDFSDLAFALHALPASIRHVYLLGFLGGRRDHELANFGEVHAYLKRAPQAEVDFVGTRGDSVRGFTGPVEVSIHGPFSVFCLEPVRGAITGACKYLLHEEVLQPLSSRGLSNEGRGRVRISATGPVFLVLNP